MTSIATPKIVGKALYLELVANPENTPEENRSLMGWQNQGTRQIIVFPEFTNSAGEVQPIAIYDRVVSEYAKKAQWESRYFGGSKIGRSNTPKPFDIHNLPEPVGESFHSKEYLPVQQYSQDEWNELLEVEKIASKKLALELALRDVMLDVMYVDVETGDPATTERVLKAKQSWQIRGGKPFAVEVTDEDLALVAEGTTPQAVIRRINKVRDSLDNFPEKLVESA